MIKFTLYVLTDLPPAVRVIEVVRTLTVSVPHLEDFTQSLDKEGKLN